MLATHGLRPAQYARMLRDQGGTCAICPARESKPGAGNRLAVDHDHRTGKIRGLLCAIHNRVLGLCEDNPRQFEAMALYLHRACPP